MELESYGKEVKTKYVSVFTVLDLGLPLFDLLKVIFSLLESMVNLHDTRMMEDSH